MLEDQPLDLSVRVGDYAEVTREDKGEQEHRERKDLPVDDYGNAATMLRLRGCFAASDYTQEREDRTCSEDSDDSCSDNNQKDGGTRSRSRPPGTKPYKKNLMRRYRESRCATIARRLSPARFPRRVRVSADSSATERPLGSRASASRNPLGFLLLLSEYILFKPITFSRLKRRLPLSYEGEEFSLRCFDARNSCWLVLEACLWLARD